MRHALPLLASTLILTGACVSPSSSGRHYTPSDYAPALSETKIDSDQWVTLTPEALRIHHSAILIDGHNDLPYLIRDKGDSDFDKFDIAQSHPDSHTDIERLRKGGVGAQFWSAYIPASTIKDGGATRFGLEQIDLIHRMVERYPSVFEMAYTADDIVRIRRSGKIASLIGVESGHAIENSLGALRMFYELGVRYITLTHTKSHDWADACGEKEVRHGGLTPFGEEVIREMNRLGIFIDISHVSHDTMRDVLRVSSAPIIASHSSAFAIAPHDRNVPDDVLLRIVENGGVIMVVFYSGFVDPEAARMSPAYWKKVSEIRDSYDDPQKGREAVQTYRRKNPLPRGSVKTVVDHIDHIVKVAGMDHVGLGSDFDGVSTLPTQLDDVSCFPFITQELLNRGYSKQDIHKILGGNLLRAFRQMQQEAQRLRN